jgi:hypothetical protein
MTTLHLYLTYGEHYWYFYAEWLNLSSCYLHTKDAIHYIYVHIHIKTDLSIDIHSSKERGDGEAIE